MNTKFLNLTSSGAILGGEGVLCGMYVSSTSSGTVKLLQGDGSSYTNSGDGKTITGVITPAVGYHNLGNLHSTAGIYCWCSGTIDVTFFTLDAN